MFGAHAFSSNSKCDHDFLERRFTSLASKSRSSACAPRLIASAAFSVVLSVPWFGRGATGELMPALVLLASLRAPGIAMLPFRPLAAPDSPPDPMSVRLERGRPHIKIDQVLSSLTPCVRAYRGGHKVVREILAAACGRGCERPSIPLHGTLSWTAAACTRRLPSLHWRRETISRHRHLTIARSSAAKGRRAV